MSLSTVRSAPVAGDELSTPSSIPSGDPSIQSDQPVIILDRRGRYETSVKPVLDRCGAVVLLLVTSPILFACAIAVRASMGKGVIYRQVRVGRNGQPFVILKFRTMHHCRRQRQEPISFPDRRRTHKSGDDPRHTRVGRYLRDRGLDELPQLVNVLRGEMSLVGPRPELWEVAERYGLIDHPRHLVKPGITGRWQVSPKRWELLHENLYYDLGYVARISLKTDVKILLKTVKALRPSVPS